MGVVYSGYYRVQRAEKKFEAVLETANKDIRGMMDEGLAIVDSLKELENKLNNPAITDDARENTLEEARGLAQKIQQKELEINQFRQDTEQKIVQRRQTMVEYYIGKIREVVSDVAQQRDADLVLNAAGPLLVYSKNQYDITDEVLEVLNKDQGKASDDDMN
tara:strand:- start:45054 stop:45539 length:486 start_codon:yes stop_codon:yes gene_type:complete